MLFSLSSEMSILVRDDVCSMLITPLVVFVLPSKNRKQNNTNLILAELCSVTLVMNYYDRNPLERNSSL